MISVERAMILMFVASGIIGYFTMPTILGSSSNVRFHLGKVYGALLMGGYMALVELFMHGYTTAYQGWAALWIFTIVVFSLLLYFQIGITETEFLRGMIEHHGMGIAMAQRVQEREEITAETRMLAQSIVDLQTKEIATMDSLLEHHRKKYREPNSLGKLKPIQA